MYLTREQKQISDIQRYVIGTRIQQEKTQADIAKVIGRARNTYSDIEKNFGQIKLLDLLTILHEMGLDLTIE